MLPGQWQIGLNPTIIYNDKADLDNKWNVPIGLTVGKMTRIGKLSIKFQLGADYSVINEDDFGDRWKFKFLVTPVMPALIKKALFE